MGAPPQGAWGPWGPLWAHGAAAGMPKAAYTCPEILRVCRIAGNVGGIESEGKIKARGVLQRGITQLGSTKGPHGVHKGEEVKGDFKGFWWAFWAL